MGEMLLLPSRVKKFVEMTAEECACNAGVERKVVRAPVVQQES